MCIEGLACRNGQRRQTLGGLDGRSAMSRVYESSRGHGRFTPDFPSVRHLPLVPTLPVRSSRSVSRSDPLVPGRGWVGPSVVDRWEVRPCKTLRRFLETVSGAGDRGRVGTVIGSV